MQVKIQALQLLQKIKIVNTVFTNILTINIKYIPL